jgi:hypothetical protein
VRVPNEIDINFVLKNMQPGDRLEILAMGPEEVNVGVSLWDGGGVTSRGQTTVQKALEVCGDLLAVHRGR